MSTSQPGVSEVLDSAAGVYAVLCLYTDGTVLMTVEEQRRARRAKAKFITDMVEPAGLTENDLQEHLRGTR